MSENGVQPQAGPVVIEAHNIKTYPVPQAYFE